MKKKMIAFPYYGGKFSKLDYILPNIPSYVKNMHYVEPFGGSMAVLINKEPSKIETYNDINGDVVNFFKVLRDNKEELLEKLYLTPYSREEYEKTFDDEYCCSIERARRFIVKIRMSMHSLGRDKGQYRINLKDLSPLSKRIRNSLDGLWAISDRILDLHIENKCALEIIKKYDTPNTFFYIDPPYQHKTRVDKKSYKHEFFDHEELEKALANIKGKFLLSGYGQYSSLQIMQEKKFNKPSSNFTGKDGESVEKLWSNYRLEKEYNLFSDCSS